MSAAADRSPASPSELRCRQAGVTRQSIEHAITLYESLREIPPYNPHLRWWIARYSRGDDLDGLRTAFADVLGQVDRDGETERADRGDDALLFEYGAGHIDRYRYALVLLSIATCLHLPEAVARILRSCERGDAIVERLAAANGTSRTGPEVSPPFPEEFDGLYTALAAPTQSAAADAIREYLPVWLGDRMDEMGFKIAEEGLGYWCFEAAGVVAALDLDDSSFADEAVYPRHLVAFFRKGR